MVLYKRKPVKYVDLPVVESDEQEVWHIPQTGEIFVDYEQYLARMDFYKQHKFICQITGHSGLSFFEAHKSEVAGEKEVDEAFPEALKGPILRRVQFQTVSRIDTLVDLIFEEFRADYYPGEAVTVHVVTGERLTGVVRDKTRFGAMPCPNGTISTPFSRYFVSLDDRQNEEAVVDDNHITRDRKIFTKQVLRSFIKKTVTREAWTGAPWLVKHNIADRYHIDTRVPPHLRFESKAAERKASAQSKRMAVLGSDYEGMIGSFPRGNEQLHKLPDLKPAAKSHKKKANAKVKQPPSLNPLPNQAHTFQYYAPQGPPHPSPYEPVQNGAFLSHTFQSHGPPPPVGPHFANNFHSGQFAFVPVTQNHQPPPSHPPPPPMPVPKYPIEDLQVVPRYNGPKRPALKYLSKDIPRDEKPVTQENVILMKSVGPLLECWDTLSVYCEVLVLDFFTFDDFVEAMQHMSPDGECELFVEAHCAALKMLVGSEADGGKVYVQLPEMDEEDEDDESVDEAAAVPSPEPEPEKPKKRATRSSLAKAEAEAINAEAAAMAEVAAEPKILHRAVEMDAGVGWIDRLRKRDFKNGGWQVIMVGLLLQLSKIPRQRESCEVLLKELAPLDMDPTPETARQQYGKLDVNLRVQALEIICMLCAHTKAIRAYMEECSEQMTKFRKEKIQWQREKKQYVEELRLLNEERKAQLPANTPADAGVKVPEIDIPMSDVEEIHESADEEVPESDDDVPQNRSLRRGNDRAAARKRKRQEEQEKKEKEREKAEAEAKLPKQTKQFTKLLKDIQKKQDQIRECEEEIAIVDNDLRENDIPRTRVLGKDRFWNRYYWFERNGMPYAGMPDSSTADAGYANGRLWVQGPDDLEREGYIDMKPEWQHNYKMMFGLTAPERKEMEEGSTSLITAHQWGYYDDEESLNALLNYLDTRGQNELKLRKELLLYRDRIVKNFHARQEYLNPSEEKSIDTGKRVSARKKEAAVEQASPRCLAWHNSTAEAEIGHIHSDQPRARKPGKKAAAAAAAAAAATIVIEEERPTRKKGEKGLGRGGARHHV